MRPESVEPVTDAAEIDHDWIRTHLGWPLTGTEAITVRSISWSGGVMGSVHRVTCAGRSFVFKGPPAGDAGLDGPPRDARAGLEAPHGGTGWESLVMETGLIAREVQSYRFLRARDVTAPKISPVCYWSALGSHGRGALALEDLGALGLEDLGGLASGEPGPAASLSGVMASGLTRTQAIAAVRCLAAVHSTLASAHADPLASPYPWLYTASSEGLVAAVRMGLDDLPRVVGTYWPGVPRQALRRIRDLDVEAVLLESHVGAKYASLCHGDAWAGNILFTPSGDAAFLIDWQFAMWGNPLSDVALLFASSLDPPSRQAWENELVTQYVAALTAGGVLEYTMDDCRADLRRAEPFAALVALATLEAYTCGMGPEEIPRFAARAWAALRCLLE